MIADLLWGFFLLCAALGFVCFLVEAFDGVRLLVQTHRRARIFRKLRDLRLASFRSPKE